MPTASWRDKFHQNKRSVEKKQSKDAFKKWFSGKVNGAKRSRAKKKLGKKERLALRSEGGAAPAASGGAESGKGKGKGVEGKGKSAGRGASAEGKGKGRGVGRGLGRGSGRSPAEIDQGKGDGKKTRASVELGEDEGASAALVKKLLATRRNLQVANSGGDTGVQPKQRAWAVEAAKGKTRTLADILDGPAVAEPKEKQKAPENALPKTPKGKKRTAQAEEDPSEPSKKKAKKQKKGKEDSADPRADPEQKSSSGQKSNQKSGDQKSGGVKLNVWKTVAGPKMVRSVDLTQPQREELFALNRKLADCATSKDLAGARAMLADIESWRWANGHTYAAAVNALCRCGDWRGAEAALGRADASQVFRGTAAAASGIVARTAMLRGYVEGARDLGKATALLSAMERAKMVIDRPNARTANTFLRGCLQMGAVESGKSLLKRMEGTWSADHWWAVTHGGAPDASSYETVAVLLCQALRHAEATILAERCIERLGASPGSGAMFVAVARAAAVCADWKASAAAAERAQELLQDEEAGGADEGVEQSGRGRGAAAGRGFGASGRGRGGGGQDAIGSGGKRGMARGDESSDARAKSLGVFQAHRRKELLAELKDVQRFAKRREVAEHAALWGRTVIFDDLEGRTPPSSSSEAAKALCEQVCSRFGLRPGSSQAKAVRQAFQDALEVEARPAKKEKKRRKQASEGGPRLSLSALFPSGDGEAGRRLHLELCSGGGEWLCAQAVREPSVSWVACELRFDRAARCFQRFALGGVGGADGNAGIIAGDAVEALERRLQLRSCDRLFVNHPEPPHQTDLEKATAAEMAGEAVPATHLLTVDFLAGGCAPVLRPGGTLTICTDSHVYGRWLLKAFGSDERLTELFEDALAGTDCERDGFVAREGGIRLRTVAPPVEHCGAEYSGDAGASYFQRLKREERGSRLQDVERCFLCLRRR